MTGWMPNLFDHNNHLTGTLCALHWCRHGGKNIYPKYKLRAAHMLHSCASRRKAKDLGLPYCVPGEEVQGAWCAVHDRCKRWATLCALHDGGVCSLVTEVAQIFEALDTSHDEEIHYSAFLAAMISSRMPS
eukprot:1711787-Amphidinium_carterae.2